ncbi:SDR family oxidoreductase [soil metagenome]
MAAAPTTLLVLGGSAFVGRAVVEEGLARGWDVTVFNRGLNGGVDPRARRLTGDRLDAASLAPLAAQDWDLVVDTWSGAPSAAGDGARLLADRADRYTYVSSASVYADPPVPGADERSATVAADPDAGSGEYATNKRGAELAITAAFGDRALLLRSCLVLGPHEDVGRLPWWLGRMARGGEVLAPGPEDLPLQYTDARDLATFALDATVAGRSGPVNVASLRGHATMGSLLETCRSVAGGGDATLTWVPAQVVAEAGIEPWTELPVWLPPGHSHAALHDVDVSLAQRWGLRCRPVEDTVADTWAWLRSLDGQPPPRPDLPTKGLDPERERQVLAAWHATR